MVRKKKHTACGRGRSPVQEITTNSIRTAHVYNMHCMRTEADHAAINHYVGAVVVEHGRNVLLRERIRSIGDEETSLAHSTVELVRPSQDDDGSMG